MLSWFYSDFAVVNISRSSRNNSFTNVNYNPVKNLKKLFSIER